MTACSPKPSAEETAAQNKELAAQAIQEAKKEILADQAAEKAHQVALATARKERSAEQRAATEKHQTQPRSAAESTTFNPPTKIICSNCGVVLAVNTVEAAGKGSGLGVVAGGVIGGLLGNNVGKGTGRELATIAGVVGGAVAGNAIEKNTKKSKSYDIITRMDSGEERIVHQTVAPGVVSGDHVKIENDIIVKQ